MFTDYKKKVVTNYRNKNSEARNGKRFEVVEHKKIVERRTHNDK